MTSKERMVTAFRNRQPDMVPVAPDISNMIPCRLTGKLFWSIYRDNDPPLWRAYLDAVRYYGMDGWHIYGGLHFEFEKTEVEHHTEVVSESPERVVHRHTISTPAGDLWSETTYYRADPPTATRKLVKNLVADFPKLRYLYPRILGSDDAPLREQMKAAGDLAAVGAGCGVPGIQALHGLFDGGATAAVYAYHDHYDLVKELCSWEEERALRMAEMTLEARPDFFMLGASGLWCLQSPGIFRDLSLPTIQKVTRMCKEANIPSSLHSCGNERELVEILANETDLEVVNPLEPPPMGDCDLAEIKRKFGHRLALMGNLHTTDVMLNGTPEDVERAVCEAIDAAGANGGFVLSTGDQCGRDTPDENIFAMVRAAREYGKY